MILFWVIVGMIINVWVTRYANMKLYKRNKYFPILPILWFVPIFTLVALILIYLVTLELHIKILGDNSFIRKQFNYFIGTHW